jgi:thiosulfate/3-mercaptopyruvate sulfurtransferase
MAGELISTEELVQILHEPDLRIFDCTTRLDYQPPGSDIPYIAIPVLDTFEAAHIPGADFLDIQGEFSDQDTRLRFMMAGTAELEAAFRRHGVANDSRVVLYSLGSPMWATRFWWMLESLGIQPRLSARWRLPKVVRRRTRD